ncbi:Tim17/Tim22/Tim23/Pmp24 family-domain-containing protein [Chaetomium sp. MPI-CAGE-AT-0009]|nr:Tim17/Tim22/Tim23/Pmp24 family-domain-containing protein [Chaetomium sp. MPI-CAGE-AT-0009]
MSIWDALTGRKSSSHTPSSNPPAAPSAPERHTTPTTPTNTFQPTSTFDPTSAQGVESFLGSSSFADPSLLHPLAGLNKDTLDYLSLEDSALSDLPGSQSALPSRGFTDDLCYGTGTTYLAGLSLGGAWGLQEGLRKSVGESPKLRVNLVLNSITRRGPFLGNSAGVVAICYNCINSYIGYLRGKNDAANTIVAGALSGMLFKSTRGLRPMAISGGIVASVAGAWAIVRRTIFHNPEESHTEALATL